MSSSLNIFPTYVNDVDSLVGQKTEKGTVWSLNGTKRYFSSIDISMYIGNTYIDDAVNIAFNVKQNTASLYGYNSYTFDDVAQGSRMIQGMFTINMTKPRFLFEVLETAKKESSIFFTESSNKVISEKNNVSDNATTKYGDDSKAMWDIGFDIDISLGNDAAHYALTGVVITGCSIQADESGENIKEVYSFIAKNIEDIQ